MRRIQIAIEEYGHADRAIVALSTVAVLTALYTRHRRLLGEKGRDKVVERAIQTALDAVSERPVARL